MSSSPDPFSAMDDNEKTELLLLARNSIEQGINTRSPLDITPGDFSEILQTQGCCFVTLHKNGELRGCIGSLSAFQPLIADVVLHAFSAAFRDSRFSPVGVDELEELHIEISVLTPQQPIKVANEEELLRVLVSGVDGLTLKDNHYHSTFLPSVWDQLPDKKEFLSHLKAKAGMPEGYWSDTLEAFRYHTVSFEE